MSSYVPILFGKYYHVFNRGINSMPVFYDEKDYLFFMQSYQKYLSFVADTFAYCLLNNHFHFLVRIKNEDKIPLISIKKKYNPSRQFSHFFNCYTRWFNKVHGRTGSIFEKPFKRKIIDSEIYFKKLTAYIHVNPIHHELVTDISDYPWSSYKELLEQKEKTFISLSDTVSWFGGLNEFIEYHKIRQEFFNEIFED